MKKRKVNCLLDGWGGSDEPYDDNGYDGDAGAFGWLTSSDYSDSDYYDDEDQDNLKGDSYELERKISQHT